MKKQTKIFLSVLAFFVAACVIVQLAIYTHKSVPASVIEYKTDNPYITETTMVSAHRSGGGIMPEETMMAFENCVNSESFNTDIFEFDLHITKDNVLVLLHDDTLDRTSDACEVFGEKKIRPENKTYEELLKLNMGAKFEDESGNMPYSDLSGDEVPDELRITRVEQVLDYLESNGGFYYIIEIKNGGDLGIKALDILYEILDEKNLIDKVISGTFKAEVSEYVDSNHPDLRRSATIKEVLEFYFKSLFGAKNYNPKYVALQIPYKLAGFNLGTAKAINYAHSHNVAVQYWTINDDEDIDYLKSLSADCIISDYPDKTYKIVHESNRD